MKKKAALIVGAGADTGGAIARAFAAEGYHACITRRPRNLDALETLAQSIRDAGGEATPFGVDARDDEEVSALIEKIETAIAPIDVCVFNIGANVRFDLGDTHIYRCDRRY